jgi:hypothetical protein
MGFSLWKLQVRLGLLFNFLVDISTASFSKSQGFVVCLDIVVGIATRYGLDSPGIESQCGRDFPHPSRPFLGPTQSLFTSIYRGQSDRGVALTTHLYLESSLTFPLLPVWAFMACYRTNFTLFYQGVLVNPYENTEHEIIGL